VHVVTFVTLCRPVVTFVTLFGQTNMNEKKWVSRTYANGCNIRLQESYS
jgi:hypothetical protein